jgi:hypothetical protein
MVSVVELDIFIFMFVYLVFILGGGAIFAPPLSNLRLVFNGDFVSSGGTGYLDWHIVPLSFFYFHCGSKLCTSRARIVNVLGCTADWLAGYES